MDLFKDLDLIGDANLDKLAIPGVWALFGKRNDKLNDDKFYCLQVYETKNVKDEVEITKQRLNNQFNDKVNHKKYINQFKEVMFEYPSYPSVQEYLYGKVIKETFRDFKFIFICEEHDDNKRRSIEKYFAVKTRSIYWRHGRPHTTGTTFNIDKRSEENLYLSNDVELPKRVSNFLDLYNKQ
jgi:hypothetical protein